jgi:ABC-type transporter Mla MlaB component
LKQERQLPFSSFEAHWSETGTQTLLALKAHLFEQAKQTWLSQSQVAQPESAGLALLKEEKTQAPSLRS